jgi:hypothetical protein
MITMKRTWLWMLAGAAILFTACDKDDDNNTLPGNFKYGKAVKIGNGNAMTFFEPDDHNHPVSIGIVMDETVLDNLPTAHETLFTLPVPDEMVATTPYQHVSLDWNPHGHGPAPIYDKPHFDMHFYMISEADKKLIDVNNPAMEKIPGGDFMPANYSGEPGGVSGMGKHWVDVTSPELNGAPFKTTFVYGTYDSKVIFHEPMIERTYLLTKPDTLMNIGQPAKVAKASHYPTQYRIRYDAGAKKYFISLLGFQHK